MSNIQSLPSYNPADTQSFEGGLRIFENSLLKLLECAIPCVVQDYDLATNTVTVKPAVKIALTTGEYMERSVIKVTAWKLHGGGFQIHYPIKSGDTGWIIAGDNDTTLFRQEKNVSDPNTYQKHKYQFGYYLPDKINGFNVAEDDKDRLVLQNDAGTEKISIGADDTRITTNGLTITGNVDVYGDLTISGKVTGEIHSTNGASGTFSNAAGQTLTILDGIITRIS